MKKHIESLDCYRGVAALGVAAIHFNINSSFFNSKFANGLFVQMFFVLSGFVLLINYINKIRNFSDIIQFIKKRILRLYPLHFFFLLLFLMIEITKYFFFIKYNLLPNEKIFEKNNFETFVYNLFLLQSFLEFHSYNTPSWSISVEFYTYVIFSIIIYLGIKKRIISLILLFIIIYLIKFKETFGADLGIQSLLSCIYSFTIGSIFGYYFIYKKIILNKNILNFLFLLILFINIFLLFFIKKNNFAYLYPVAFGLLFYLTGHVKINTLIYKIIFNKFLIFLGKISYSIYMSHLIIFWILMQFLRFIIKLPTYVNEFGVTKVSLTNLEANIVTVLCYVIVIIFSYLTHKHVELRFYNNNNFK